MKLDRNINKNGRGKYALLKLRVIDGEPHPAVKDALDVLANAGILDWGNTPESEFFVIRLKDKYAGAALGSYALAARIDDLEYSREIAEMAARSGPMHPNCKRPD